LDETTFSNFRQYKDYIIINVAHNEFKDSIKSGDKEREIKSLITKFQLLIGYMDQELKDTIKDIKISTRLNHHVVIIANMINDTPSRKHI
jgi:HSP90 family molecular chaperone